MQAPNFKIKSVEDDGKEWGMIVDELIVCYESQFRKLKEIDFVWKELHELATEIQYNEEEEVLNLSSKR